jgi:hypothetical protein
MVVTLIGICCTLGSAPPTPCYSPPPRGHRVWHKRTHRCMVCHIDWYMLHLGLCATNSLLHPPPPPGPRVWHKRTHRCMVCHIHWHVLHLWLCANAGVAWCHIQLLAQIGLAQLPGQCMLTTTVAHYQHVGLHNTNNARSGHRWPAATLGMHSYYPCRPRRYIWTSDTPGWQLGLSRVSHAAVGAGVLILLLLLLLPAHVLAALDSIPPVIALCRIRGCILTHREVSHSSIAPLSQSHCLLQRCAELVVSGPAASTASPA